MAVDRCPSFSIAGKVHPWTEKLARVGGPSGTREESMNGLKMALIAIPPMGMRWASAGGRVALPASRASPLARVELEQPPFTFL